MTDNLYRPTTTQDETTGVHYPVVICGEEAVIYGPGYHEQEDALHAANRMCNLKQAIFDEAYEIVTEGFGDDPPE